MKKDYESSIEYSAEEQYLYLLLIAPGYTNKFNEPIQGNTWLQKTMYVLSQRFEELNYNFDAGKFGIFSSNLARIQDENIVFGILEQKDGHGPLSLTPEGRKIAEKVWDKLSDTRRKIISQTKDFLNEMNREELISFSYSTFPQTTINSTKKDDFNRTRLSSAISLFKRDKVSLNKASFIAGMSEDDFIDELKKEKIPAYSITKSDFDASLKYLESIT